MHFSLRHIRAFSGTIDSTLALYLGPLLNQNHQRNKDVNNTALSEQKKRPLAARMRLKQRGRRLAQPQLGMCTSKISFQSTVGIYLEFLVCLIKLMNVKFIDEDPHSCGKLIHTMYVYKNAFPYIIGIALNLLKSHFGDRCCSAAA